MYVCKKKRRYILIRTKPGYDPYMEIYRVYFLLDTYILVLQ